MKPVTNLIPEYLARIEAYWFHGPQARFARDAGVTESTFGRILHGKANNPRYRDICRIADLIEKQLGVRLDPRDVFRLE